MFKITSTLFAGALMAAAPFVPANAFMPISGARTATPIVPVAEGCPAGWYRGPWGQCRDTPYSGPLPGGGYQSAPTNGCAPGYWRGPWGNCRDTDYHGRLPDGSWKP